MGCADMLEFIGVVLDNTGVRTVLFSLAGVVVTYVTEFVTAAGEIVEVSIGNGDVNGSDAVVAAETVETTQ